MTNFSLRPDNGRRARGAPRRLRFTMAEGDATSSVTIEMGCMGVKGHDDDDRVVSGDEENEPLVASTSLSTSFAERCVETNVVHGARRTRALPTMAENGRGMVLYALGVTFSSVTALTARLLHRRYAMPVHFIVLGRASCGLLLVCVALVVSWLTGTVESPFGTRRAALLLRGVVGTCAVFSFFLTAANLPLADAAVPALVAPLVTTLGAAVWLREKPHWAVYVAFPVCVVGASMVLRPGGDGDGTGNDQSKVTKLGVVAAVAQTFFGGVSKLLVRLLSGGIAGDGVSYVKKEHPLVLMLYVNCCSVVFMVLVAIGFMVAARNGGLLPSEAPNKAEHANTLRQVAALLTLSTFSGFGAQLCITNALGRASASAVMPVHYTGVFWAVLWGACVFGETPGAAEAVGIGLVALGSAAASVANLRQGK